MVEAFYLCLTREKSVGEIVNVGTGVKTTVAELLHLMVSFFDEEILVHYEGQTSGDIMGIYADIKKMHRVLGDWNKTNLSSGLKKMIDFYK